MTWIQELLDNTLFQAFLAIIAIVGFGYAVLCQRMNKEKKEFSYLKISNSLIREKKSKYEKLSVMYDGCQVKSLCVSNITIWNSGNRTINCTDIVASKELTITALNDDLILDVEIISCSEETNKLSVSKVNEQSVKVFFDYVDPKDGVTIQIIHTGTEESISLDCKIKGGKPIRNHINESFPKLIQKVVNSYMYEKAMAVACGVTIALFLVVALLITLSFFIPDLQSVILPTGQGVSSEQPSHTSLIAMAIIFGGSGLVLMALFIPIIKILFHVGIPHKLKKHL